MRIKICGITRPYQACAIVQAGAQALGFICVPQSPRFIPPDQIGQIVEILPSLVDRVGVFMNPHLEIVQQTVKVAQLNSVQLHGMEPPEFCQELRKLLPGIEIIKALRVRSIDDLDYLETFSDEVDWFLLDAYHPDMGGGSGRTLDWSSLGTFRPSKPWFLAGGISPDNVAEALSHVTPDGLDLSSGVEVAPGDKDLLRVTQLFDRVKAAIGT